MTSQGGFTEGFATRIATVWHWRIMLAVAGLATTVSVVGLFSPELQLMELPSVVSAYGACVAIAYLLTSLLLFIQFRHSRRVPQALLGAVYLFCGLIVLPHVLFFPGVLPEGGLLGAGSQGSVWLWAFWHIGFLVFMICFVLAGGFDDGRPLAEPAATRLTWVASAVPPLLVLALTVLVTRGQNLLPELIRMNADGKFVRAAHDIAGVSPSVYTSAAALLGIALVGTVPVVTRCRRLIDLGLAVAVYATFLDTILNVLGNSRYSLGWYVARTDSLLSSGAVLAIFLNEIARLYLKASEVNRTLEARTVELEAAKEGAEAASRSKSAFLATMSHEIRTPINAVLGLAHLLGGTRLDAEQQDFVGKIDAAGRSLLAVVNDVLDLSRVESGRLELDPAPFQLHEVLDQLTAIMSVAASAKGIELVVAVDPAVPRRIEGDRDRLLQILANLVGNGVKFTESGRVSVYVAVIGQMGGRAVILFTVTDTGIGIPAGKLPALFEAFAQGDNSTTRRYGGSGLGLTIAKRLVEMMGGAIGADSNPGRGSSFWFTVPLDVMPEFAAQGAAKSGDGAAPAAADLRAIRILLVEDNAANQFITRRILERQGASVEVADDGQQAVERLRAAPAGFDAVLMDVQMPVMDGYAATRLIRRELGLTALPIIALTAGVLADEQELARDAGMTDFLGKPAGVAETVHMIRRHLVL